MDSSSSEIGSLAPSSWRAIAARLPRWPVLLGAAGLVIILVWSYWEPMVKLVGRWWNEPDYLHGFLVPVLAGVLLWLRRDMLTGVTLRGSWWGLVFFAAAAVMRWVSAYSYFELIDPLSIVPCLAGVVLFVGGWRALHWAWPAVFFLGFMVPLPGFIAGVFSHPLQRAGTIASTYLLQLVGIPTVAKGNVIVLTDAKLGVVEACNGLRMMMLFVTVCVGAAFVVKRPLLDKVVIVLSAAPIALAANVLRITATGILHETTSHSVADWVFHDLAGWFMMPTAVVLLWIELWLISKLLVPAAPEGPFSFAEDSSARRAKSVPAGKPNRRTPKRPPGKSAAVAGGISARSKRRNRR